MKSAANRMFASRSKSEIESGEWPGVWSTSKLTAAEIDAPADGKPLRNLHGLPHHALQEAAEKIVGGVKQVVAHAGP